MSRARLIILACAMVLMLGLTFIFADTSLTNEEERAYDRVEEIKSRLKTNLIGVEWSEITTTLGPLEAKRTATDPRWAAWLLRYFDSLGIERGDKIVINASGSFPGLVLASLVAAEIRGLDVSFYASMTSSTWGANRPEAPLPVLLKNFQDCGLKFPPPRLTIGGKIDDDAEELLKKSALDNGFELLESVPIDEIINIKPKLIILIGGSASSAKIEETAKNLKILKLLNLKKLCEESGIPYGGISAEKKIFGLRQNKKTAAIAAAGLLIFFIVLKTHKRWEWL